MEILEVNPSTFSEIIPEPYHVFGSAAFAELNQDKASEVFYLLFKDGKYRLGITAGILDNILYSPFSAPFGGFVYLKQDVRLSQIDEAVEALIEWAKRKKLKAIQLTLPPGVYDESFIVKQANALFRQGFIPEKFDLNYSFNTKKLDADYPSNIWRNARKNLNIALENDLGFNKCIELKKKQEAYEIIKTNREKKGFPLRMNWKQIEKTIELVPADFFLVHSGKDAIAAAQVFHVASQKVQVIYWGDIPEFSHLKPMNFLAFRIFEYYKEQGVTLVDLGPSTENSQPNHGLCEFKEGIGCDISQKMTFHKKLI